LYCPIRRYHVTRNDLILRVMLIMVSENVILNCSQEFLLIILILDIFFFHRRNQASEDTLLFQYTAFTQFDAVWSSVLFEWANFQAVLKKLYVKCLHNTLNDFKVCKG